MSNEYQIDAEEAIKDSEKFIDKENDDRNKKIKEEKKKEKEETILEMGSFSKKKKHLFKVSLKKKIDSLSYYKKNTIINKIKKKTNTFYFVYTIITLIHFLIYVNRGIIPGSYKFLSTYLGTQYGLKEIDLHIGLLSSIFILGLSLSSLVCGPLASTYGTLQITLFFLWHNTLALLISGIAIFQNSYSFLVFARFFSGCTEAAFLNSMPSLICYYAKNKAGAWISIFLTMFPLGGCIGYSLAVILPSNFNIGSFFILMSAIYLLLCLIFCFFDEKLLMEYEKKKTQREEAKKIKENINCVEKCGEEEKQMLKEKQIKKKVKDAHFKNTPIKSTKKCSYLCGKKEINSINKKMISDELKVNSDKTNSMETDCLGVDDSMNVEIEDESVNRKLTKQIEVVMEEEKCVKDVEKRCIKITENKDIMNTKKENSIESENNLQHENAEAYSIDNIINIKQSYDISNNGNENLQITENEIMDQSMEKKRKSKQLTEQDYQTNKSLEKEKNLNVDLSIKNLNESTGNLENKEKNTLECIDVHYEKPQLKDFLLVTLGNPSFIILVIILTAYSEIIQNYIIYGAPILYSLNIYPSYKVATFTCSVCGCISSIVGTCLGGLLTDLFDINIQKIDKYYEHITNNEHKIKQYAKNILVYRYLRIIGILSFVILFISSAFMLVLPFICLMYPFTIFMALGLTFLFLTMSSHNIGIMVCVPNNFRPFVMGVSTFVTHIFGDIPWTILLGKIKGVLAPDCSITKDEELTPECAEQREGLKWTLFILCSKMLIMTFGSFAFSVYAHYKIKKLQKNNILSVDN